MVLVLIGPSYGTLARASSPKLLNAQLVPGTWVPDDMGIRAAAFTLALFLMTAAPAAAERTKPVQLSPDGLGGMAPKVVLDGSGSGMAAWATLKGERMAPLSGGSSHPAGKAATFGDDRFAGFG